MIVILKPSLDEFSAEYRETVSLLQKLPQVETHIHTTKGKFSTITEIHLIGDTSHLSKENIEALPGVSKVIQITKSYQLLGRRSHHESELKFVYNSVVFNQHNLHIFAGLCAVDNLPAVDATMRTLASFGQTCTRMGAFKPRTSPYAFQGLGEKCFPYVFELAGKYGIKVIAMEITHERHIELIHNTLEKLGNPTGVMLQIGTRNAQNFDLLQAVGEQKEFPILYKRGYGITLDESLNAAEYIAKGGNLNIVFCLRGVKTILGSPHRNLTDFAQIPIIKRLTRMPVCIDPSHSIGNRQKSSDGIYDIFHATAQGIIAGANMLLVDIHPTPHIAEVDGRQALPLDQLGWYLEDIEIAREAYLKRLALLHKVEVKTPKQTPSRQSKMLQCI